MITNHIIRQISLLRPSNQTQLCQSPEDVSHLTPEVFGDAI